MGNKKVHIITLGFALFAMFFGAGNLILPPYIGVNVGAEWVWAIIGFVTTGIIAPFFGLLAVTKNGLNFTDLRDRTHPLIIMVLAFVIMWSIGPLVAIPRTGATTYEMAMLPFFPSLSSTIGAVIFFTITFILSVSPAKIVDIIGKYLTPFLVILLITLIVLGILSPVAEPNDVNISALNSFQWGFDEGYQTLDVLASVVFAGIIISAAIDKGYHTTVAREKIVIQSGIVAVTSLLLIYGGLIYLGATSGYSMEEASQRTVLFMNISHNILGGYASYIVSVAIALACLTTAIALTTAFGSFMTHLFKNKIPYVVHVLICCLLSVYFSIKGVDEIITYAGGLLNFVYPITFALILTLLLFGKKVKQRSPYIGAIIASACVAFLSVGEQLSSNKSIWQNMRAFLPLSSHNLEWLIPSLMVFGILALISRKEVMKANH